MNNKNTIHYIPVIFMISGSCIFVSVDARSATLGSQSGNQVTLSDGDLIIGDASLSGTYGVYGTGLAPNLNLANDVTISVADSLSYAQGIVIKSDSAILNASSLNIEATGARATGIQLTGKGIQANLGVNTTINTVGNNNTGADGIIIRSASSLSANGLSINTEGDKGAGIRITDHGTSVDLGFGSIIHTNGASSYGVYIDGLNGLATDGLAKFSADSLKITTEGLNSYGLNIQRNTEVNLGSNTQIKTTGDGSFGIWSFGNLSADNIHIETEGANSNGIEVRDGVANIGGGSTVKTQNAGGLVTNGNGATINYIGDANNRNKIYSSGSYGASAQFSGASINLKNTDIYLDRNGNQIIGLWALGGGIISAENINIVGGDGSVGVYAMTGSEISLAGTTSILLSSSKQIAIGTQYNAGYSASNISGQGLFNIIGSIYSRAGVIDLDFLSGSKWIGSAYTDNVNSGLLDISLTDSIWQVTNNSSVDNLELANSTVEMTGSDNDSEFTTLSLSSLSGNGTFIQRANVAGDGNGLNNTGDLINIKNSSSGSHILSIGNDASQKTNGTETLTVVETSDGQATFKMKSKVEFGGYLYDIEKKGNNWQLHAVGSTDSNSSGEISTTAKAGASFYSSSYMINYLEYSTLSQRIGEIHSGDKGGNIWLRGYSGQGESLSNAKLDDFKMPYDGFQFGVDKYLSPNIPITAGMYIGSTKASPKYTSGKGAIKSDYYGFYASYLYNDSFYTDLNILRRNLKNSFNVFDSQGVQITSAGKTYGTSISVETGYKIKPINSMPGAFIEPQTQLSYGHQNGLNMEGSNSLRIKLSSYDSLIGRLGVLIGYENNEQSRKVKAYVKSSLLREFKGQTDYYLNESKEQFSFKGNAWSNGIGIELKQGSNNIYGQADYIRGDVFNDRKVTIGYRYSF